MRFDDSLKTVLSADMGAGFGAQSAWRQLVDLIGRGRSPADEASLARLRLLRGVVPDAVRAASARALAFAAPDVALVGFFAEDSLAIAAPVLRTANLPADDWLSLLPRLTPAGRSVLRHRRDLSPAVGRGLESFGSTDFVLAEPERATAPETTAPLELPDVAPPVAERAPPETGFPEPVRAVMPSPDTPLSASPFLALGAITRALPVVAEALRHAAAPDEIVAEPVASAPAVGPQRFEISDLVKRIDAFTRDRVVPVTEPAAAAADAETFRYETDATGVIRWVDGVSRAALVGVSLGYAAQQGEVQIDGIVAGGYRRRSPFDAARLEVGGLSDAAGSWRMSGVPAFDDLSGRFIGFRGSARRPRRDEVAAPAHDRAARPAATASPVSDSLRQLVHELRTPTNAIAGFAELIETELLGPVSPTYRERATAIRGQASDLIAAIEDLDTAARIEGHALDLRPTIVPVQPLIDRIVGDLAPLAELRGARVIIEPAAEECEIAGDDRAVERLVSRLLATLVSAASPDERLMIAVEREHDEIVIAFDRPRSLAVHDTNILLSIDAERENERDGAPLLGTGFALRLAQNFATEMGGHLAFEPDRLTLRLPAVVDQRMERVLDRLR